MRRSSATFERDKDELRSLGVPIEVGNFDPLFDDEPGYRILSSEFALPAIDLDAEEAAVVGVATRVGSTQACRVHSKRARQARCSRGRPDTSNSPPWSPRYRHLSLDSRPMECGYHGPGQLRLSGRQPRAHSTVGAHLLQGG